MFSNRPMGMGLMKSAIQQLEDRYQPASDANFLSGAVDHIQVHDFPASFSTAQPQPDPRTHKDLLSRLGALSPKDAATDKRIKKIIVAAMALLDEVAEIETKLDRERLSALKSAHVSVRAQGRKLLKEIEALEKRGAMVRFEWHEAEKAKAIAGAVLRDAQETRKRLSRWAADETVTEADKAIVEAQESLRKAILDVGAQLNANNELVYQVGELRKQLAKLELDEIRLRGELSGKAYVDPEFHLTRVPAV